MLLVLHQGAIGDFLLTLSVAASVRDHLANPPIEVIASAASARWAAIRGLVDAYHSPESVGLHTLFAREGPRDNGLTQLLQRATVVASFLGSPDEPIHARLAAATSARVISVDPRPTPATLAASIHITDQWSADIRAQGVLIGNPIPTRVTRNLSTAPLAASQESPCIILHPGSGGRHKCWPLDYFLALADALTRDGAHIAWMLGPAEREPNDDRFAVIAKRVGCVIDAPASRRCPETLILEDDLSGAAGRIACVALYIGNDGGMTQVAAATGVPTLAIFTATDPRVWRPLGDNTTVIDGQANNALLREVHKTALQILELSAER